VPVVDRGAGSRGPLAVGATDWVFENSPTEPEECDDFGLAGEASLLAARGSNCPEACTSATLALCASAFAFPNIPFGGGADAAVASAR
jgi:hypothetical protein